MPATITSETLRGYKGQEAIRARPGGKEIRGILRREFLNEGFFLVPHRGRRVGTKENPKFRLKVGDGILIEQGQARKGADGKKEVVSQFRIYEFAG
jgi:hypothetical protein